ncbi:hypothetical protein LUQ84_001516 [Hamiltosporidium tvaerminnensis]|nr:hypothetical protein LUQ84_001516 [Hamiltosporidium tvaerminnensis]
MEAYIQSIVLKKTVETISNDRKRELESEPNAEQIRLSVLMGVIKRDEMHEELTLSLKEAKREEDGEKNLIAKIIHPIFHKEKRPLEEPTNNITEESDLEEETTVVKEVEENI